MAVIRYSDGLNTLKFLGPYKSERVTSYFKDAYHTEQLNCAVEVNRYLVGCRSCINCRKERSLNMATRAMLEIKHFEEKFDLPSQFITLTYNDENLPKNKSLYYPHFQSFMKNYRRWLDHRGYGPIKFFMCGEYGNGKGSRIWNPHYHAIIFGHMFSDLIRVPGLEHGHEVYHSPSLAGIWKKGYVTVGDATIKSARYVANYIHKKDFGPRRDEIYEGRTPEFVQGSKRKGIGLFWLEDNYMDIINSEELVIFGERFPIPSYYTRKLTERFPASMYDFKKRQREKMFDEMDKQLLSDESPLARRVREGTFSEILHEQTFRRVLL